MKIEAKERYYDRSCGCCSDWGVTLVIDGKEVEDRTFSSATEAYEYVLEEILGHTVKYTYESDYGHQEE